MHRLHGLQGSLKRRCKHPSPTSINGYHTAKKLLSQSPAKRPTSAFAGESGYTHSAFGKRSHTAAHTPKHGHFRWGWYHYPRSVPHVHELPRAGYQNGVLCRFWALAGGALEEHRKPAEQRCAYACRCPEGVAAPLGCVIFLQFGDVAVFSLCAQYFLNVRGGGGITTLGAFHTVRKPCVAVA